MFWAGRRHYRHVADKSETKKSREHVSDLIDLSRHGLCFESDDKKGRQLFWGKSARPQKKILAMNFATPGKNPAAPVVATKITHWNLKVKVRYRQRRESCWYNEERTSCECGKRGLLEWAACLQTDYVRRQSAPSCQAHVTHTMIVYSGHT